MTAKRKLAGRGRPHGLRAARIVGRKPAREVAEGDGKRAGETVCERVGEGKNTGEADDGGPQSSKCKKKER